MYAANWLMMLAQALLLSNWIAGLSGLVTFAFMYFLRVGKEEQMMLQEFGEQYQQYMAKTGRVMPRRGVMQWHNSTGTSLETIECDTIFSEHIT
jgi:protein-S-isoprenylcysteine O-methyltransferase Ste14